MITDLRTIFKVKKNNKQILIKILLTPRETYDYNQQGNKGLQYALEERVQSRSGGESWAHYLPIWVSMS
jgi:hypothetical protein